ncbi:MAG: histidine phosphatase family protein [Thiomicrorhabdus sp.]|nr:histidine phosphatase family protein [Thiomicrorhabdus sp.]
MKNLKILLVALFTFLITPVVQAEDATAFWQALKEGGKVVLVRHAEVDSSMGDSFLLDDSCFSEKNLNDFGRQQAKEIHKQFVQHKIQIDKVLASPHCRTKETAELAFGEFTVTPVLRLTKALTPEQANDNIAKTKKLIADFTKQGNLILVTHRPNIGEIVSIRVEPSEMVVIEPLGDGLFDVITRIQLLTKE